MKKILVTGGNGLIGSWLQKEMPEAVYVSSKDFDLTNQNEVDKMFSIHKPNIVIHLAAKVGGLVDNINHPVSHLDDNLLINTLTLKYAYKHGVERFLSILSYVMYSNSEDNAPFKEEDIHNGRPHETVFSYAMVKRIMATQIENYNKEYGTKYNYLIPCNLYGPLDKEDKIIPLIINKVKEAKKNKDSHIMLFGDGTPFRQFIHSKDMSKIIKYVIDNDITDSFNVAPHESYSINYIANTIVDIAGADDLEIKYDSTKPNGQTKRDVDVSKFNKIIPNYKFMSLYDGISECYKNE
jgi:GDP-L-fucose synthase